MATNIVLKFNYLASERWDLSLNQLFEAFLNVFFYVLPYFVGLVSSRMEVLYYISFVPLSCGELFVFKLFQMYFCY